MTIDYPIILLSLIVAIWILLIVDKKFRKKESVTEKLAKEALIKTATASFGIIAGILAMYYGYSGNLILGMDENMLRAIVGIAGFWILIDAVFMFIRKEEESKKERPWGGATTSGSLKQPKEEKKDIEYEGESWVPEELILEKK